MQVLYSLSVFRDAINKLRLRVEGVAIKIKKLFNEIETSGEPARTPNYERYLDLQRT